MLVLNEKKCKNIPHDILTKYFTFIAVNENIPKIYTPNKYKIINEWEYPFMTKHFKKEVIMKTLHYITSM
jgi:hypothetical protein